jgi:hypothetical protein
MERTNGTFAKEDVKFQNACKAVGIPATARQASKFRAGKGKAFKG